MGRFRKGMIVRTSYGTGPYRIMEISKSTEPSFLSILQGDTTPSPLHYTFECRELRTKKHPFWLNGYNEQCRSVWSNDYLIVCSEETTLLVLIANGLQL